MANSFRAEYRSTNTLTTAVSALLGISALLSVFFIFIGLAHMLWPDPLINADGEAIEPTRMAMGLVFLVNLPTHIVIIVVFLIWIYRSYANLSALRSTNLKESPGWAVGWWFIPFANFVKPYLVMKEIWRESQPRTEENIESPVEFPLWWAGWLVGNILSNFGERLSVLPNGDLHAAYAPLLAISSVFTVLAALCLISLVRGINRAQELKYNQVRSDRSADVPPPPPVFD